MSIRLAAQGDAEDIRTIYNEAVVGSTATFDLVPRSPEDQEAWMAAHAGGHPVVVAALDEVVAGFGALSPFRDRPAYATTVENSVWVAERARGCGVGRALLDELVRLARAHGFHSLIARIVGGNEGSIALHKRCGYEVVGVEREVGRKFGRWLDVVVMQRML